MTCWTRTDDNHVSVLPQPELLACINVSWLKSHDVFFFLSLEKNNQ